MHDENDTKKQLPDELDAIRVRNNKLAAEHTNCETSKNDIRKSEGLLRRINESSAGPVFVIGRDLRVISGNWRGILGFVPMEIRDRKPFCFEILHPHRDKPCEHCHVLEVFDTGKPGIAGAFDSGEDCFEEHVYPLFDDSGNIDLVVAHINDVTEHKKFEIALKKGELKFKTILENAPISTGHKRIEETLKRSNQLHELLAETASILLRSDSPQEVIDSLCRKVMVFLKCDAFFNYLVDYEKQRLHLNACAGIPDKDVQKMEWLDYGVGLCGCSARDGTRLVVEDLQGIDDQYTALVRPFGIQAYACHPLISQGQVLGTLSFCSRTRSHFTDDELSIMETVADQVAIAIDRKLLSERISQSEKRFRELFEKAQDAIFLVSQDYLILDCNFAATELLRCNKNEIVGKSPFEFTSPVHPDGCDAKQKALGMGETYVQGNVRYSEWICQRPDGTQFEALIGANRFDLNGEVATLATIRDISARKRTETALRESEERFRGFMDNNPAIAWMKDEEGRYVYLNKSYEKRLGVRLDDIKGKTDFELWPQHIAKQFRENDLAIMGSGNAIELIEEGIDFKGEHLFWLNSKFLIRDSCGRRYVGGIGIDITTRKELENELRTSESRFRALVETTSDCIWEVDENEHYTYVSPKVSECLGYMPTEVIGKTLYDFLIPEQVANFRSKLDVYKACRKAFFVLEKESLHKNGNIVIIETSGVPVFDRDGNFSGFRGVDRNITEHKMLEERFMQAKKMEVVGQLANGIAHDFNNIVMAIKGYLELLLPRMENDQEGTQYMKRMGALAERAKTLTLDLLAFSRKEGVDLKPNDLNQIVRHMKSILKWLIGDDIRFKMSLHHEVLPVMAVSGQIEQVLINMATNARDATSKGGLVMVSTSFVNGESILFKPDEHAKVRGYALLSIADTGTGMDDVTKLKIFEPFFTLKEVGKGTGLGLTLVYGIVKQHGGFINVDSREGFGTTFNIYMPLIDVGMVKN